MADRDFWAFYDFTVSAYPAAVLAPEAARSAGVCSYFARSPTDSKLQSILDSMDASVRQVYRAIAASARAHADLGARLRATLDARRRRAFHLDFAAKRRFPVAPGRCLLCDEARSVATFPCCQTPDNSPTVCLSCLEQSAFASSMHGTRTHARCPFCAAEYAVYQDRPARKRKRE